MKKNYLFAMAGSLLISGLAIGQSSESSLNYPKAGASKTANLKEVVKQRTSVKPQEKGALLWEDDFSDPNTWTMTNTSTPSTDFSIETNPDLQSLNVTTMPAELTPFDSDTPSNGFLWISSDAAPGNSDQDGTPIVCEATSEVIDLSGSPYVTLSFQHNYRWWQDTRGVRVSGDNGQTWTEFEITDQAGYPNDQNSENPTVENIDISSIAGDSSQVLIQFYYNDNDYWGWYWAVDDVKINEADPFDLRNEGIYWGAAGNIGVRVPYYQVPLEQVTAYDVSGRVANVGYQDQNDIVYTTSVVSEGFTSVSNAATINGFSADTVDCNSQFTPSGLGKYIFDGAVTSSATDATPTNNTVTGADSMEVTDYIYARDNGVIDGSASGFGFDPPVTFEGGSMFDIVSNDDLYSIDAVLGNTVAEGIEIYGTLYEITSDPDPVFIAETEYYTTGANDAGIALTLPFSSEQTLEAGKTYMVTLSSFATEFSIATAGYSPDGTSLVYGDLGSNGVAWYYTNSAPVVRMNFDPIGSVEGDDMVEANVSVYPNPANEETNVSFSLENASDVEVVVTDLSGKTVYSTTMDNAAAGQHNVVIPTAELSNGVYVVNYTAGNAVSTEKLVVNK